MSTQQYVLDGDGHGTYVLVVHFLTPAGNNAVGTSWATALVNSGRNKTVLPTGTGPGQIASADAAAIAAGTMIEIVGSFNSSGFAALDPTAQAALLSGIAASMIADRTSFLSVALNYFGFTQGVAS